MSGGQFWLYFHELAMRIDAFRLEVKRRNYLQL